MLTRDEFHQIVTRERASAGGRFIVPVYRRLSADLLTPVSAFLALRPHSRYPMLLESVEGGEKLGRYSFILKDPYRIVTARGQDVTVTPEPAPGEAPVLRQGANGRAATVFDVLQGYVDAYRQVNVPDLPRLTSGAVGYFGYDVVRLLEHLPDAREDDLQLPDAFWCFYDTVVAFDHVKHQIIVIKSARMDDQTDVDAAYDAAVAGVDRLEQDLRAHTFETPEHVQLVNREMTSNVAREDYEAAVARAKQYIYEGDIFQVVLSQRFGSTFRGDRFNLYRALRQVNPSPYLFYLDFDDFALIGSSPEVLVRVEDRRAEVLPIAGTRPRGASETEDHALELELVAVKPGDVPHLTRRPGE